MQPTQKATGHRHVTRHYKTLALALGIVAAMGCGGGGGDENNNNNTATGLELDDDNLLATAAAADFTCVDATDPAQTFGVDSIVSGIVEDFETHQPVAGVTVSVYTSRNDLLADLPWDVSDPSDSNGGYSVLVPGIVNRLHYKMSEPGGTSYMDTMELEDPVAGLPPGPPQMTGKDRKVISWATVETVQLTVGVARIVGRGIISGTVYDCARAKVENAAVRVYDGPETDPSRSLLALWDGSGRNSFYFYEGMPSRLQSFTNYEGLFITANLVAGASVTVEIWGRSEATNLPAGHADCAEGCLVSTQEVPVIADTVVITDLVPRYAD